MTPTELAQNALIPIELADMVFAQAKLSGVSVRDLRSESRGHVELRGCIARKARANGYSYWTIGRALNRDHSTVRYHVVGRVR